MLNHHIKKFIATLYKFKLVENYYFMVYLHWFYTLLGRYSPVICTVTSASFAYCFLFKSWRSYCLETENSIVSRTKLSNLFHFKYIKCFTFIMFYQSRITEYHQNIFNMGIKCEGQTEGLVTMTGMHTYYCNMQTHDTETIERISTEILQSPFIFPFVIIHALHCLSLDFFWVLAYKSCNVS